MEHHRKDSSSDSGSYEKIALRSISAKLVQCLHGVFIHLQCTNLARNRKFYHEIFNTDQVHTDEGGIKLLNHRLSACTANNPLVVARGRSRTGGQIVI